MKKVIRFFLLVFFISFLIIGYIAPKAFAQKPQEFTLTGFAYEDVNQNGVYDVGDIPLKNANLTIKKAGLIFPANTNAAGNFIYKTDLPGKITLSYIGNLLDKKQTYSKTILIQNDIPNVKVNFGINPLTNAALFQSADLCDPRCNNKNSQGNICYSNKGWGHCDYDSTLNCYYIQSTAGECPSGYCNQNTNQCEQLAENCGAVNQTCCGGFTCKSAFSKCTSVSYGGYVCLACGGFGQPVCINNACQSGYTFTDNGYCCLSGQTYNGSACVQKCGGENEKCCWNQSSNTYSCNSSNLTCTSASYGADICTKCGGAGQPVCNNNTCSSGYIPTNGYCCSSGQSWTNNSCQNTQPPTITLLNPTGNTSTAQPGNNINIQVSLTNCSSVDTVAYYIDGALWGYLPHIGGQTCTYSDFWNATQGQHKLTIKAFKNAVQVASTDLSPHTITVCPQGQTWNGTSCGSNSGTINISDPKNGATAKPGDPILISATLSSCDGVDLVTYSTKTNLTQTGNLIKLSGCTYTATWTATEGLNPITATAYFNNQKLVSFTSNVVNVYVCPSDKNWDSASQTCIACTGNNCTTQCSQKTSQSTCESPSAESSNCYWSNNTCQPKIAAGGNCDINSALNICALGLACGLDGKCGDCNAAGESCCRSSDPNTPTCNGVGAANLTCNKTTKLCEVASGEGQACGGSGIGAACPANLTCTSGHCCASGKTWDTTTNTCKASNDGQVCGANNTCPANQTCTSGHCCTTGTSWDTASNSCKTVANDVIVTFIRPTNGQVLTADFPNGLVNLDGKGVPLAALRFCYDTTSGLCFDYPTNQYIGKTTAQVSFQWVIDDISNGPHKLLAIAKTNQNKSGQGEVSVTINVSGKPQPTNTPIPTATPVPTNTPVPTTPPNTPIPTTPPQPTDVPTATSVPNPTATGVQPTATGTQPTATSTITPPAPTLTAIALTPTITSAQLTPTVTATQPTLTAIALTPTSTGVQPTSTPKPTNVPTLEPISLVVEPRLPGIGVQIGDNGNPKRKQRTVEVIISTSDDKNPKSFTGTLGYFPEDLSYAGKVQLTEIPTGSYIARVRLDNTLFKKITGVQLKTGPFASAALPIVTLISGDLNSDNVLNVADYNIFRGCYGSRICSKKDISDFNEDGVVEEKDLNILLRGMILTTNGD